MSAGLTFPCVVKKYADGTWYCALCNLRGDADEDVADFCLKVKIHAADTPTDRKPAERG